MSYYEKYDPEKEEAIHDVLLLVRARASLELSSDIIEEIDDILRFATVLRFGDGTLWEDGVVFGITSSMKLYELASLCAGPLGKVAEWSFYSKTLGVQEFPPFGNITRFVEKHRPIERGLSVSMLYTKIDDSSRVASFTDRIRFAIQDERKGRHIATAMSFRNGQAMLVIANEPAAITTNRFSHILRGADLWIFESDEDLICSHGDAEDLWGSFIQPDEEGAPGRDGTD